MKIESSVQPLFIVLSGPSGVGKDAVLACMKEKKYALEYIITVTTRPPRPKEKDKIDYYFVPVERFQQMLNSGELLEYAQVYGNWYGVPKEPIRQALKRGQDAIVKVDIQGAITIKRVLPQAVFIFLAPWSIEELAMRLQNRNTERRSDLELRLSMAQEEMKCLSLFDYLVINKQDEIEMAASKIAAIIAAEKCRVVPRKIEL